MKKLIAILLFFVCLFGTAFSESFATPTDLYEEFDDDDWGYIDIPLERKVYIIIDQEPTYLGDTVKLIAVLVDFKSTDKVAFQWQYATEDEAEWISIDNATEQSYTFILDRNNMYYWYRVIVEVDE